MVSGALGKISRLCPLSDGPSDDGFQLTLSVSKFTYLINAFCSLLFGAPSLGTLGSCPSRLPLDPPLTTRKENSIMLATQIRLMNSNEIPVYNLYNSIKRINTIL